MLGVLAEGQRLLEEVPNVPATLSGEPASRAAFKDPASAMIGPWFSTVKDTLTYPGKLADGELSEKDAKAALRLAPYNNLWWLGRGLNALVEGAYDN